MDITENYNLDNKELDDGRVLFTKIHNAFSGGNSKNNQYTAIINFVNSLIK
jgi:hypothetical protein